MKLANRGENQEAVFGNFPTCDQPAALGSPGEAKYRAPHLVGRRLDKSVKGREFKLF